jgi:hypothetical protein
MPTNTWLRADINYEVYNDVIYFILLSFKLQILSQLAFLEYTHYNANVNSWIFETTLKLIVGSKHVVLV